jgi:hypothetical protein
MRLDTWGELDDLAYDRELLADLATLRFTQAGHGVLVLGPVGVGKTHIATALGHIAIRRRLSVHAARADKLLTRLRAARLDNSLEAELRKLARVDLLILDDFALKPLDATQTNDFYELIVERHQRASTIVTSNREPAEWLTMMSDALLADPRSTGSPPVHTPARGSGTRPGPSLRSLQSSPHHLTTLINDHVKCPQAGRLPKRPQLVAYAGSPGVGRQIDERPPVLSCRRDHWTNAAIRGGESGSQPADRPLRELDGRTLRWLRLVAPDYY